MSEEAAVYETRVQHWREQANFKMLQRHLLSLTATWRCLEPLLPTAREALTRQHQQQLLVLGTLPPGEMLAHLPTYGVVLDAIHDDGTALVKHLEELWQRLQALQGDDNGPHPDDRPAA
jgi:hypothetical protein